LGWHPKQDEEIMTLDEMIAKFEITDIHKSGAVLDPIKLDWMNGEYIKRMEIGELHTRLVVFLEQYASDFYQNVFSKQSYHTNTKILMELQSRMKRFDEFIGLTESFYSEPIYVLAHIQELLVNEKMKIAHLDEAKYALQLAQKILIQSQNFDSLDSIKAVFLEEISQSGKKNGQILWPIRVALSGAEFSP
jgi:glutamyl/glutaminyl-tRNA synthetase